MWFPPKPFPRLNSIDLLQATLEDLKTLLLQPPTETFVGHLEDTQRGELIRLNDIIQAHTTKVPAPPLGVLKEQGQAPDATRPPEPAGIRTSQRTSKIPQRYNPAVGNMAINPDTGAAAEYKELAASTMGTRWKLAMCKELGRLFQGYKAEDPEHNVMGTNTCQFIQKTDIPENRKPTYVRIVTDYREQKHDPYRVRCTVGGNLITFPGDKATKVADLITIKCLINKIVSTPDAKAGCIDIKDFYLNNDLPNPEYIFFSKDIVPEHFQQQYKHIFDTHTGDRIYARVDKGMYGLPQAGKVASDTLLPRLQKAGYGPTGRIAGLYKHKTRQVYFALVVDDFLVMHCNIQDFAHLSTTLKKHYTITTDQTASKFCGITIEWNYKEKHATLSMPGYVQKALLRFTHPHPARPQHSPHRWVAPHYGAKVQYAETEDNSIRLDAKGIKRIQEVIGTFLYSARAVDNTMLVALSTLAAAQTKGTEKTMKALTHLLDYAATHPDAAIRFHKSDMILYVHSDASYLSEPQAKSRVGGYFYLGSSNEPAENPKPNGPIHVEARILKNIMAAASEAEIAGTFHNGQETVHIRQILAELGHPQARPTQMTVDNSTADGFANKRLKIKRSKAIDMRFYWVQDRVEQGDFGIRWGSGKTNHADYFTKHHPPSHHIAVRPTYLYTANHAYRICACTDCASPATCL
jgi:Reverse transcriptase (RNA-dependent DNA polymerase)